MPLAAESRGAVATVVAVGVVVAARLWLPLGELDGPAAVGRAGAEGPAHLWGLFTAAEGFFRHGPWQRGGSAGWPGAFRADLIDPVHLVLVAPAAWLGGLAAAGWAWNLLPLLHLGAGAAGAWRLAARAEVGPWGRAVAAAGVLCAPAAVGGAVLVGRSEVWPGFALALPLSFALDWLDTGARRALAAALLAAVPLAWGGWQPLLFAVLAAGPVLFAEALVGARWRRLGLLLGLCAALVAPLLLAVLASGPWWLSRMADPPPSATVGATLRLASLVPGARWASEAEPPPWPGIALAGLAVLGAVRLRRAPLLLWLGALWLLSLGPKVEVGLAQAYAPAAALQWVLPPLRGVQAWGRLCVLLAPLAAPLVGAAVDRRGPRGAAAAALLAMGVLLAEGLRWGSFEAFPLRPSAALAAAVAALPPGALVELPEPAPAGAAGAALLDRGLLDSLSFDRPTSRVPSPHSAPLATLSVFAAEGLPAAHPCARSEAARLHAAGAAGVLVRSVEADPGPDAPLRGVARAVRDVLGAPVARGPDWALWRVQSKTQVPAACAPPLGRANVHRAGPGVGEALGGDRGRQPVSEEPGTAAAPAALHPAPAQHR